MRERYEEIMLELQEICNTDKHMVDELKLIVKDLLQECHEMRVRNSDLRHELFRLRDNKGC